MRVVDNATVRRIDEESIARGTPSLRLMENAGSEAARIFLERTMPGPAIVLCGRGNNGGDGLVLARHLHMERAGVVVLQLEGERSPDCETNLERAREAGVRIEAGGKNPAGVLRELLAEGGRGWIVDALLGSGFSPPLREPLGALVGAVKESGWPVFALDAPTGVDGDGGEADERTPTAAHTVVFGPMRAGLVRAPARGHCGRFHLVDPGFDPAVVDEECSRFTPEVLWIDAAYAARRWPRRPVDAHKYRAGSVLVVAGSAGMSGAAGLAASAAHRAGAGLVEVLTPAAAAPSVDASTPESLVRGLADDESGGFAAGLLDGILRRASGRDAFLLGCGLGDGADAAELAVELCASVDLPMIVDADGLNAFSRTGQSRRFSGRTVLTPHAGELGRLLDVPSKEIVADPEAAARGAAERFGCTVLLKGAPTVVASPTGACAWIGSGGPELATAGSGDVLAGVVAALLAAGLEPFAAATTAAWVHGRAGERLLDDRGTLGLVASDLLLEIARTGRELEQER